MNNTIILSFYLNFFYRVFGTSMVEEYEEIADSQYQSERQELFDEDYGKQIISAFLAVKASLLLAVWLIISSI